MAPSEDKDSDEDEDGDGDGDNDDVIPLDREPISEGALTADGVLVESEILGEEELVVDVAELGVIETKELINVLVELLPKDSAVIENDDDDELLPEDSAVIDDDDDELLPEDSAVIDNDDDELLPEDTAVIDDDDDDDELLPEDTVVVEDDNNDNELLLEDSAIFEEDDDGTDNELLPEDSAVIDDDDDDELLPEDCAVVEDDNNDNELLLEDSALIDEEDDDDTDNELLPEDSAVIEDVIPLDKEPPSEGALTPKGVLVESRVLSNEELFTDVTELEVLETEEPANVLVELVSKVEIELPLSTVEGALGDEVIDWDEEPEPEVPPAATLVEEDRPLLGRMDEEGVKAAS